MIIIVGLGNPGKKFQDTRHNLGFTAVDFFAKNNGFPDFEPSKKCQALISQEGKIILVKPQTFMNNSGVAVKKITSESKWRRADVMVIHDDIDLPLGALKIIKNRGAAGHKGVESIIKNIGNKNLIRFRLGIQPSSGKPKNSERFVIKTFTKEEKQKLQSSIEKTSQALDYLISNNINKAMNKYNG